MLADGYRGLVRIYGYKGLIFRVAARVVVVSWLLLMLLLVTNTVAIIIVQGALLSCTDIVFRCPFALVAPNDDDALLSFSERVAIFLCDAARGFYFLAPRVCFVADSPRRLLSQRDSTPFRFVPYSFVCPLSRTQFFLTLAAGNPPLEPCSVRLSAIGSL